MVDFQQRIVLAVVLQELAEVGVVVVADGLIQATAAGGSFA